MGLLKGSVHTSKFITAHITDSDNRFHTVPIKHKIGNFFLVEIDGQYFAFTMKNARILTNRTNTGIGKSYQVIQYDTSHFSSINPHTKELEHVIKLNGIGRIDRQKHGILSILANRENLDFGKWKVGEKLFDSKKEAETYYNGLLDKRGVEVRQIIHDIDDLVKIFEKEEGDYPDQVKEIKAYLETLDIKHIVTPVRPITDFITDDLIATASSFLGEGVARAQRLDGTLRAVTNVPVKQKGNMLKYMVVAMVIGIAILGVYALNESGALKGITDFTDNLGTIQEGFKGLPAPGAFQTPAGSDYSDSAIQNKYPDCEAINVAINSGELDYNKLSGSMKGLVDSC